MAIETLARRYSAALFAWRKSRAASTAVVSELDAFVGALDKAIRR